MSRIDKKGLPLWEAKERQSVRNAVLDRDAQGHDDVEEGDAAFDDGGGVAFAELEGDFLGVKVAEAVHDVGGVVGSGEGAAGIFDGDHVAGFAGFGVAGGEGQGALGKGHAHGVGLVVGHDGNALDGGDELVAGDGDALVAGGRDDGLIFGVDAFDELAVEAEGAAIKHHLAGLPIDAHGALAVAQKAHKLGHGLGREDHFAGTFGRELELLLHKGQALAVGGDHGELGVGKLEEHAGEDAAGFVGARGVGGFAEHLTEDGAIDGKTAGVFGGLFDDGEFVHVQADDAVFRRGGHHACHIVVAHVEMHLAFGRHAQHFHELAHGERGAAGFIHLHVGCERGAHRDVEVRGGQRQAALFVRFDHCVRNDLKCGLAGDNALNAGKQLKKTASDDGELHGKHSGGQTSAPFRGNSRPL